MTGCDTCKHMVVREWTEGGQKLSQVTCERCGRETMHRTEESAIRVAQEEGCWCAPETWEVERAESNEQEPEPKRPVFWKPEPGQSAVVRVMTPDNIAVCVNSSGMEDAFDVGIEYMFEGEADGEMLSVYDKTGTLRECFRDRFEVKSGGNPKLHGHFKSV